MFNDNEPQVFPDWVYTFSTFLVWAVGAAFIYLIQAFILYDLDAREWGGFGRFILFVAEVFWVGVVWDAAKE